MTRSIGRRGEPLAADDCIIESNLVPPKGSRWYYHIDRATWFLMKVTTAQVTPRRDADCRERIWRELHQNSQNYQPPDRPGSVASIS